jgi:hypothetical protein
MYALQMSGGRPAEDTRLTAARAALARAERRLRDIRRRALRGGYDAPAFARAVAACREAEAEVRRTRSAVILPAAPAPAPPAAPPAGGQVAQPAATGEPPAEQGGQQPAAESPAGREAGGGWARR